MKRNGLRPRATLALSVVAGSLFLLLCLANYGQGGFENAGEAPWHLSIAGWFVDVFGAGAFALVLLPLVWGVVVYFREDTPSLAMRGAGTILLACAISMVSGLVQGSTDGIWAGAVGEYTVSLTEGLGGGVGGLLAMAVAWAAAVTLFMTSLVWATDWWFHSLRKGPVAPLLPLRQRLEIEPTHVELRGDEDEDEDAPAERQFVDVPTPGANAVDALDTIPKADAGLDATPAPATIAEGFSGRSAGDRVLVRGPSAYEGVEFLPPSDELAPPARPEERVLEDVHVNVEHLLEDELFAMEEPVAEATAPPEPEPAAEVEVAAAPAPAEPVLADEILTAAATPVPTAQEPAERPRSGIGIPDDSPFVDEFFAVDVLIDETRALPGDGASADAEVAAAFGTAIPVADSPESRVEETAAEPAAEPEPVAAPAAAPVGPSMPVIVDELLFADAYDIVDEEIPAPIAARSAPPPASAPAASDETSGSEPTLQIDGIQLDPLFQDAVDVVLDAGRGSAMSLQRRFGIGHGRGLRLLEQMEQVGILAPEDASGMREVRVSRADWEAFSGSHSS